MELLLILASQVFSTVLGYSLLSVFFFKDLRSLPFTERTALSYVIGMGIIPLYMSALYLVGAGFSFYTVYLPGAALIMAAYMRISSKKADNPRAAVNRIKFSAFEKIITAFITFEAAGSFFRALMKPVESFDSVASFAIKAKIFFLTGGIPAGFFLSSPEQISHPQYPILVPLQEAFCFMSMGSPNDLLVNIIFPAHFLALLVLFYSSAKAVAGRRCALIFTFILSSANEISRFSSMGYTDVHFALYLSMAVIYWYRHTASGTHERLFTFIAAVFSAFAIFTKSTGFILPFIFLLLFYLYYGKKKGSASGLKPYVSYLALVIILTLPWLLIRIITNLGEIFVTANVFSPRYVAGSFIDRIVPVLYEFQANVFNPKKWNLLWPVFLILFAANYRWSLKTSLKYITIAITSIFLLYFLFYITVEESTFGSGSIYAQSLRDGMSRHLIHIVPLVLLWLAVIFKEEDERAKN